MMKNIFLNSMMMLANYNQIMFVPPLSGLVVQVVVETTDMPVLRTFPAMGKSKSRQGMKY